MIPFFIFLIVGGSSLFSATLESNKPLGLQECYELAVMKSESLGMKESEIKIQEALYWQAISTAFPQIHATATPTWQDQSYTPNINRNSNSSGNSSSSKKVPTMDSFEGKITVAQPLFKGFREFSAAGAAKETQAAKGFELRRSRELLYEEVASAFFQTIQYEGDLNLIRDLEKTLEDRVAEVDRWVKIGRSRPSELVSVKSELAESRANEQQTRALLQATKELLAYLTGVPSTQLRLLVKPEKWNSDSLEAYLKEVEYRPDYLAALSDERASRKKVSVAQADHLPSADVSADYSWIQEPRTAGDWKVMLTLDLPLFEGGLIDARIKEQKALLRQNQLRIEQLKRSADQEIRTRFSNFNASSLERVRLKEWVALAEENYSLQKIDYEKGVVSQLEVMSALQKWTEAKRRYWSLSQENQLDWIKLHVAAGKTHEIKKGSS
jgi:outer membrane protein